MAQPSDEDFKLFGKILFYGLIIPALLYYLYQGVKFCFSFIFPIDSNNLLENPDPDVKVDNAKIKRYEATNEINNNENRENLTSQKNYPVYIVLSINMISSYPKSPKSFLSYFFQPSPQPTPSFSDRVEDTIKGRRSIDSRLKEGGVHSSLDDANQKLEQLQLEVTEENAVVLEATSDPLAYRVICPKIEAVRPLCGHSTMSSLVRLAFSKIKSPSSNNHQVKHSL